MAILARSIGDAIRSLKGRGLGSASRALAALMCVIGLLASGDRVDAQSADCERIRQELAALSRGDPSREAKFARAVQQQRSELARTQAYADQIGCGQGLSIFGRSEPTECDAIASRIDRMQSNLGSLEEQSRVLRNGDPERAADLNAQYDASCRADGGRDQADLDPMWGSERSAEPGAGDLDGGAVPAEQPQGGSKTICVRTCDGGFFPMATSIGNGQLDGLQNLCSAMCPNTEAKLYTTNDTDDIGSAVALDGSSYTALPAAFKYQKTFDAACTCKPPHQTWVEALAQAEQLLDKQDTRDVVVTEKLSADMARPSALPDSGGKPGKRAKKVLPEAPTESERARGAQAPTVSSASAGIAAAGSENRTIRAGEGAVRDLPGPDGATRHVRIVGPAL